MGASSRAARIRPYRRRAFFSQKARRAPAEWQSQLADSTRPSCKSTAPSPLAKAERSSGISAITPPKSIDPESSNQSIPLFTFHATFPAGRYRRPDTSTAHPTLANCDTDASSRERGISTWCVGAESSQWHLRVGAKRRKSKTWQCLGFSLCYFISANKSTPCCISSTCGSSAVICMPP